MIARNLHFYELMYDFWGIITMMKNSIQKKSNTVLKSCGYLVLANTLSFANPNTQPK